MKISKIRSSRDGWKEKAKHRGSQIRNLRKTSKRQKKRQQTQDKERMRSLEEKLATLRSEVSVAAPPPAVVPIIEHRTTCVLIVIFAIVSFRSVPRILRILQPLLQARLPIPHFTSVIHWTLRVGVAVFNQVAMISGPWICIVDCSIDIGTRKALVVLRVPLGALQTKRGAIGLEDCECIGLEVAHKWNGQLVFEALTKIFSKAGSPLAIIKDGGTDLNKGVQLVCEQSITQKIFTIEDVGHYAANALKAAFAKTKPFIQFLQIISNGTKRIRQTKLAYLLPPKIRTKGRFQGITEVAKWAKEILELIGGRGKAKTDTDLDKARKAFAGLSRLRSFLSRFCRACAIVEELLQLLKIEGLSRTTYAKAKNILVKLPKRSLVRKRLTVWLKKHIAIHKAIGLQDQCLLVSSDVIESLFGKFKTIIQRNPNAELNRLLYVVPLLCGKHTQHSVEFALQACTHGQMRRQIEQTIPLTLRQQRFRQLGTGAKPVPKSGDFGCREPD